MIRLLLLCAQTHCPTSKFLAFLARPSINWPLNPKIDTLFYSGWNNIQKLHNNQFSFLHWTASFSRVWTYSTFILTLNCYHQIWQCGLCISINVWTELNFWNSWLVLKDIKITDVVNLHTGWVQLKIMSLTQFGESGVDHSILRRWEGKEINQPASLSWRSLSGVRKAG